MESKKIHSDKRCDICGDSGFVEDITICSQCNQAREHVYCMRTQLNYIPGMWFCESCQSRGDEISVKPGPSHNDISHSAAASGSYHHFKLHDPLGKQKVAGSDNFCGGKTKAQVKRSFPMKFKENPTVSKVKFIPVEEVALLASGAGVDPSVIQGSSCSSLPQTSLVHSMLSSAMKTTCSKVCLQKQSKHLDSGSVGDCRSIVLPDIRLDKDLLQLPPVKGSEQLDGGKALSQAEQSISMKEEDGILREPADVKPESAPMTTLPVKCVPDGTSDVQELVLPPMLPEFLGAKLPNSPSGDALWRGSFEIFDRAECRVFNIGLQALRPTIVSHKVCEFSKRMPRNLQFKLQHHCEIWPQIFLKECPTATDIGLYFFPEELDRSKAEYIHLLNMIEKHDLAMKSCLGGVELLIFTSRRLPVDSQSWLLICCRYVSYILFEAAYGI